MFVRAYRESVGTEQRKKAQDLRQANLDRLKSKAMEEEASTDPLSTFTQFDLSFQRAEGDSGLHEASR